MSGSRQGILEPKFHLWIDSTPREAIEMIIDPWEKAAECERSLTATPNLQQRAIVEMLRNLWIALGNTKNL